MAIFTRPLFGLFSSDPNVISLGLKVKWIDNTLEFGRYFNIIMVRNLQAVGDIAFPVAIGICGQWILGAGLAYLFGIYFHLGPVGI